MVITVTVNGRTIEFKDVEAALAQSTRNSSKSNTLNCTLIPALTMNKFKKHWDALRYAQYARRRDEMIKFLREIKHHLDEQDIQVVEHAELHTDTGSYDE